MDAWTYNSMCFKGWTLNLNKLMFYGQQTYLPSSQERDVISNSRAVYYIIIPNKKLLYKELSVPLLITQAEIWENGELSQHKIYETREQANHLQGYIPRAYK